MSPDAVNGLFELGGAVAIAMHIRAIVKSRQAHGVSLVATSFFFLWGLWNLYYYPHLEQWMSFTAGVAIASLNCVWVALIIHYRRIASHAKHPQGSQRGP